MLVVTSTGCVLETAALGAAIGHVQSQRGQGRDLDNTSCPFDRRFSDFMGEAMQNVTIASQIHEEDHRIVSNELPAACMAQIVGYNAHPELEYGSATD
jgi:hypothetical protein